MGKYKVNRGVAIIIGLMTLIIAIGFLIVLCHLDFKDDIVNKYHTDYGWIHLFVNTLMVGIVVLIVILIGQDLDNWSNDKNGALSFLYKDSSENIEDSENKKQLPFKKIFKWGIAIIVCFYLYGVVSDVVVELKKERRRKKKRKRFNAENSIRRWGSITANGRGYTLGLFFTNWRYSPCYQ